MASTNDCAFCLQPIVTKTRSVTHFVYRCGHVVHTRCVTAYVYESDADVTLKFRCIMCRQNQSTWFPTRVMREMAIQSTCPAEVAECEHRAVTAFFESACVNSFMPGRVGYGNDLKMVKIPERFDETLCTKNIKIAIAGMLGKKSFVSRAHFEFITGVVILAVTHYIEEREVYNFHQAINVDDFNTVRRILFPF
mgnify:CR=1 FL=1